MRAANTEEISAHAAHDHIAAVLPDREAAEAAVIELRELGLGSEHLGLAVHGPSHVAFENDEQADLTHKAVAGTAAGANAELAEARQRVLGNASVGEASGSYC